MAVIWGEKIGGRSGVMTADDVVAFIQGKVGVGAPAWRANIRAAVAHLNGHNGAGGGSALRHRGKTVFHVTCGAGANHVTLFFTNVDGIVASIIGVGSHRHAHGPDYDLEWHTPGWQTGNVVQL